MPDSDTKIIQKDLTYVIDCIDTVTAKIEIIKQCTEIGVPVISALGTGNKLDPSKFEITDIYKTSVCPLAKVMRKELRKRNIEKLKVIYSKEEPIKLQETMEEIKSALTPEELAQKANELEEELTRPASVTIQVLPLNSSRS